MEVTIGEHTYRTGKLDATKQFHVARRLAPVIFSLGKSISEVKELAGLTKRAEEVAEAVAQVDVAAATEAKAKEIAKDESSLGSLVQAFKPMADVIAKMSDEEVDYITGACLGVCERQQPGGWAKVRHINGRMMFEDMDMPTMLQLTITVIKENIGNFFPDPQA